MFDDAENFGDSEAFGEDRIVSAPFWILYSFLGANVLLVFFSYVFKPTGVNASIWLGLEWFASFLLLLIGYYLFSTVAKKRKMNPNWSTPPKTEVRHRLVFLSASFVVTILTAVPFASELARIVRF
jgi:hypothetical protein